MLVSIRRFLGVLIFVAPVFSTAAARPAAPSDVTPRVTGVVRDSSGAPLHDVNVIIPALNRSTVTNDSGRFVFTGLPAGTYHITTLQIGYRPGHADVVVPQDGAEVQVVIVLTRASAVQQLASVQVTATPTGTDARDVAQSTTEVSGQELARGLSSTIAQTLSREPGISVRYNGPAASAPVIRGLSGERVLVLQDGERAGDLSATSADHAVSIDPLTAKRVEIVRGPASLLYGNNALGGVVNVISNDLPTTIPTHLEGYLAAQTESATPGGAAALGVTVPLNESLALVGRLSGRKADELRTGGGAPLTNSQSESLSGVLGAGLSSGTISGGALYRGYSFNYGLPSATDEGAHIEGRRHELSGRTEFGSSFGPVTSLKFDGGAQWYSHDEIERSGEIGTRFNLRTQSINALGRTQFGKVTGAAGVSGSFRQYEATGEEALTPGATSRGLGAFLYQEIPLVTVTDPEARLPRLQIGARYDSYAIDSRAGDAKFGAARSRRFNNVSGSLGVNMPFADGITAAISVARAFRAPTVEELFSNAFHAAIGTYDIGNPNLRIETSQGADAIIRVDRRTVTAQLSAYVNRVANFITPDVVGDTLVETDDGPETVPLNRFRQADATLKGLEGKVEVEMARHVVLGVMGDLVRGDFRAGGPLPYIPPARLGALARYDDRRWSLNGEFRHAFSQTRVPLAVGGDPAGIRTDAFDLVNLSAGYSFEFGGKRHGLTLRADNVLDERYREASSRLKAFAFNPGRNLALGYRTTF